MNIPPKTTYIPPYQQEAYRQQQPASQDLKTSYNRQQNIADQNAKTGGNYDYDKETSGNNAQLVLNILV